MEKYPESIWDARAACADEGINPDIFTSRNQVEIKLAKKVCQTCVLKEECLNEALDQNIKTGVWGGMSASERERLSTKRRRVNKAR